MSKDEESKMLIYTNTMRFKMVSYTVHGNTTERALGIVWPMFQRFEIEHGTYGVYRLKLHKEIITRHRFIAFHIANRLSDHT